VAMQGIPGRREATGRGVFFGIRSALDEADLTKSLGLSPGTAGKRVIVQGLGNVGYHAAHFLQADGNAIITGIAEYEGGLWNPDGLDVRAVAEFRLDALHLSFCMVTLCPFIKPYTALIKREFPDINIVLGTHRPADRDRFKQGVKELLCQTLARPQTMNDLIRGTLKIPQE